MRMNKIAATLLIALLITPSLAITLGTTALTVETDKAEYEPGEEAEIFGTAEAGLNVEIKVMHELTVLFDFNVTVEDDGNYSEEVTLPEDKFGTFTVNAAQGDATAQTTFAVVDTSGRDLAHELLREAEELREDVEETFEELEGHGNETPAGAEGNFTLGLDELALALVDFDAGNYSDAAEEATLALGYFGAAFELAQEAADRLEEPEVEGEGEEEEDEADDEVEDEEDEDDVDEAFGLYVAIERALIYLERVNDTAERLLDEGYTIDPEVLAAIRGNLTLANVTLRALYDNLGTMDPDEAAREFAEMRGLLGRTNGLVHSSAMKEHKLEMTERFMNEIQNQIRGLKKKMLRLRERLDAGKFAIVGNSLGAASRKIERLRERLATEGLEGLLDELQGLMDEIDGNLTTLNGEGMSTNLRAMNSVEARIRVLNRTVERLRMKGYNTTDAEAELRNAEGLVEEMMTQLTEGDTKGAKGLLKDAEDRFKEIRENLHTSKLEEIKQRIQEKHESRPNGRGGD